MYHQQAIQRPCSDDACRLSLEKCGFRVRNSPHLLTRATLLSAWKKKGGKRVTILQLA